MQQMQVRRRITSSANRSSFTTNKLLRYTMGILRALRHPFIVQLERVATAMPLRSGGERVDALIGVGYSLKIDGMLLRVVLGLSLCWTGYFQESIFQTDFALDSTPALHFPSSSSNVPSNSSTRPFTSSSLVVLITSIFTVWALCIFILLLRSLKCVPTRWHTTGSNLAAFTRPQEDSIFSCILDGSLVYVSKICLYEALQRISYTSATLGECGILIGLTLAGAMRVNSGFGSKDYGSGSAVCLLVGSVVYGFSQVDYRINLTGLVDKCLGAILVFASIVFNVSSITARKAIPSPGYSTLSLASPTESDPSSVTESLFLNRLLWSAIGTAIASFGGLVASFFWGSFNNDWTLLVGSSLLARDVGMLSLGSAFGSLLISNFLESNTFESLQELLASGRIASILVNASSYLLSSKISNRGLTREFHLIRRHLDSELFSNITTVGLIGWIGVGLVTSGVYLRPTAVPMSPSSHQDVAEEKEVSDRTTGTSEASEDSFLPLTDQRHLSPLLIPLLVILVAYPVFSKFEHRLSPRLDWGTALYKALDPVCVHNSSTELYATPIRTGFVSYPRSGNSYVRSLLERVTGFQTASVYCDPSLATTFLGECEHENGFFVKDHFPYLAGSENEAQAKDYFRRYDQVVHLVRNPLDSIASFYHLESTRPENGTYDHTAKAKISRFDSKVEGTMLDFATRWAVHAAYWAAVPLETHTMRYEDLHSSEIPGVLGLLEFLKLPPNAMPQLQDLACLLEPDTSHQAYTAPKKKKHFASWDQWDDRLRQKVLEVTRDSFCKFGYDRLLVVEMGQIEAMEGFCDGVALAGRE